MYTWRLQANFNQKQQNHASKKIEKHEFNLRSAERCWLGALAAWHLWWHDRHTTPVTRAHTGRPCSVCAPCLISFDYQQKPTETASLSGSASCVFRCTVWNRKGSSFLDNKVRHVLVAVAAVCTCKRKWNTLQQMIPQSKHWYFGNRIKISKEAETRQKRTNETMIVLQCRLMFTFSTQLWHNVAKTVDWQIQVATWRKHQLSIRTGSVWKQGSISKVFFTTPRY